MSLGTSGTLFAYAGQAMVDDEGRWAAFCDSTGGWLPLICTMNCTVATEAVARLCDFSTKQGDELLAGTRPGAGGLLMLPFFNGERTPNLPDGRGSLFGMTATNLTPANLYRAAMEGAVYSLKNGYDAFVDAGMRFEAIRLTGGGSHSAVWRQMVADVFGLPVDVPEQAEGAAFGAALQALWASERAGDTGADLAALAAAHVRLDPRLSAHPHAEATAAYAAQYQRFLSHLDAIRPLYA
jgi:xylulokinase